MSDVIQALRELLDSKVIINDYVIKEDSNNAKLTRLTISGTSNNMLLLGIDQGRRYFDKRKKLVMNCLSPLFNRDKNCKGHNQACDAVLVHEHTNKDGQKKLDFYYLELKSDKPTGYTEQFISTQCFMHYILKILERMYDIKLNSLLNEKFIIFYTSPMRKTTTTAQVNEKEKKLIKVIRRRVEDKAIIPFSRL